MHTAIRALACAIFLASSACSPWFWGGAAAGSLGTGAAYEHKRRDELHDLKREYKRGEIDRNEYLERKKAIEDISPLD